MRAKEWLEREGAEGPAVTYDNGPFPSYSLLPCSWLRRTLPFGPLKSSLTSHATPHAIRNLQGTSDTRWKRLSIAHAPIPFTSTFVKRLGGRRPKACNSSFLNPSFPANPQRRTPPARSSECPQTHGGSSSLPSSPPLRRAASEPVRATRYTTRRAQTVRVFAFRPPPRTTQAAKLKSIAVLLCAFLLAFI